MSKLKKMLKNPNKLIRALGKRNIFNFMSDSKYLRLLFRAEMGYKLDLNNPKTYNEKLQWLKLYDRNPIYTKFVDKYEVREYIKEKIGEEYLIPLIFVYDDVDEIDWDVLPNQFVLKCTHGSGSNIVCRDKEKLDIKGSKKKLNKWMKKNWYWFGREWVYKELKPRIICEKYFVDDTKKGLKDYKFYCFDGEPKAMMVATERGIDTRFDFFDMEFNHLPFEQGAKNSEKEIKKPQTFEEMKELAKKLSRGISHVRVDFYESDKKVYFGELTFFDSSGLAKFEPKEYDYIFGSWVDLSKAYIYKEKEESINL